MEVISVSGHLGNYIQLLGTESSHQVSLLISSYFTVNGQNYCQIPSVILNPVLYGVLLEFYFIRVLCTDFDIHDEIHCWSPRDIISCSGLTCYIWHHRHRHQLFYPELWLEEIPLPHTETDWPKHWQLLSWWVWEAPLSLQDHHSPHHLALVDRERDTGKCSCCEGEGGFIDLYSTRSSVWNGRILGVSRILI